ncbi:spermidine/putrescine ABC transporter, permease protein [Phenylobacterium zucineum HLK1]|uniref:Spermidine/putrescine ABC transporter, permease protein n=1 Tax=Phenylobacterium zucineum (strain HLK1) TaxID=450851 RepID=B4R8I9_PHEZH|nr:ABC transporter permease subunit [Phenylobacterium zucineum]ACG77616.1 spermidine/putrescine ABC transporter, permease protein [Phenylobacterium zucineum HLK1]
MRRDRSGLAALLPYAWLLVFFGFPVLLVARLSLSDTALAMPPYAPRIDWSAGVAGLRAFLAGLDLETYARLAADRLYLDAYASSLRISATATVLLLLVGYPMAWGIVRCRPRLRSALVLAVILPFWTSFLIRIYAWIAILKPAGLLNAVLGAAGLPPVDLLNTEAAVILGLVYAYLPFMVLPLYAVLERRDERLVEAARDLGAGPLRAFWTVTFPLSLPGVAAGALLCFIPMAGEFVVPDLLGGSETLMLGRVIWTEFFANRDWPAASAVAIALLATLLVPILLFERQPRRVLG